MNKSNFFILFFIVIFFVQCQKENYVIKGQLLDIWGLPISDISVIFAGCHDGFYVMNDKKKYEFTSRTTSDADGKFEFIQKERCTNPYLNVNFENTNNNYSRPGSISIHHEDIELTRVLKSNFKLFIKCLNPAMDSIRLVKIIDPFSYNNSAKNITKNYFEILFTAEIPSYTIQVEYYRNNSKLIKSDSGSFNPKIFVKEHVVQL